MKSIHMKPITTFALAIVLAPAALAQPVAPHGTFVVDADASEVRMTLKTTHELVNGVFRVQAGKIEFDRGASKMSGSVVVLPGSGKTGNDTRDGRMTKEILKVKQFATVTFEPKTYTGDLAPGGESTIQVTGIFTLLGTPHEITVPMVVHLDGPRANAKAHLVLPYIKWGLKNPSILMWKVDPDVAIDVSLSGKLSN
jgi:polyisoprenoid-binding protein YceI